MDFDGENPPQVPLLDTTRTNTAENQNGTARVILFEVSVNKRLP
jgi:hypothetical protein